MVKHLQKLYFLFFLGLITSLVGDRIECNNIFQLKHDIDKKNKIKVKVKPKKKSLCPMCTIDFYQEYFSIETRDIYMRFRCALFPTKPEFLQLVGKNPDLWGPFWIPTTMIFLLFAAGNISQEVNRQDSYNFNYIYVAFVVVYLIAFLLPTLMWVILNYFLNTEMQFMDILCIYGYSLTVYVPVLIIALIPISDVQWAFFIIGFVIQSIFLSMNYIDEIKRNKKVLILIAIVIAINLTMVLVFKMYFLNLIYQ